MTLDEIDTEEQQRVIDEFRRIGPMLPSQSPPGIELDGLAGQLARSAVATRRRRTPTEDVRRAEWRRPFDFLHEAEDERLAQLLAANARRRSPWCFPTCRRERAGEVLARFAPALQVEVVRRLADIENTDPEILREVERALEARCRSSSPSTPGRRRPDPRPSPESWPPATTASRAAFSTTWPPHDRPLAEQFGLAGSLSTTLPSSTMPRCWRVFQRGRAGSGPGGAAGGTAGDRRSVAALHARGRGRSLRCKLDHPGPIRLSDIEEARRQMAAWRNASPCRRQPPSECSVRRLNQPRSCTRLPMATIIRAADAHPRPHAVAFNFDDIAGPGRPMSGPGAGRGRRDRRPGPRPRPTPSAGKRPKQGRKAAVQEVEQMVAASNGAGARGACSRRSPICNRPSRQWLSHWEAAAVRLAARDRRAGHPPRTPPAAGNHADPGARGVGTGRRQPQRSRPA